MRTTTNECITASLRIVGPHRVINDRLALSSRAFQSISRQRSAPVSTVSETVPRCTQQTRNSPAHATVPDDHDDRTARANCTGCRHHSREVLVLGSFAYPRMNEASDTARALSPRSLAFWIPLTAITLRAC